MAGKNKKKKNYIYIHIFITYTKQFYLEKSDWPLSQSYRLAERWLTAITWLGLALHWDCNGFAFSCEDKQNRIRDRIYINSSAFLCNNNTPAGDSPDLRVSFARWSPMLLACCSLLRRRFWDSLSGLTVMSAALEKLAAISTIFLKIKALSEASTIAPGFSTFYWALTAVSLWPAPRRCWPVGWGTSDHLPGCSKQAENLKIKSCQLIRKNPKNREAELPQELLQPQTVYKRWTHHNVTNCSADCCFKGSTLASGTCTL